MSKLANSLVYSGPVCNRRQHLDAHRSESHSRGLRCRGVEESEPKAEHILLKLGQDCTTHTHTQVDVRKDTCTLSVEKNA